MKSLVEELLEYFNKASEEQIKKDWESIHTKYAYGIEVQKFIEDSRKFIFNDTIISNININSSISEDFGGNINLAMAA